jgi:coenzyme F420-reducing hydrogenase delta subunit
MKTKKQSRLDSVEQRIAAITNVLQQLITENENLRTMTFGTHETIKLMPGHDEAIKKLKEKATETKNEKQLEI